MKTNVAVLVGKSDAGNSRIRFDEGNVASAKPRRGSLLYKLLFGSFAVACGCCALAPVSAFADLPEGWRQVEFIGSSGSQWINTGISPTASSRIVCRFSVPFAPIADGWCGSSVGSSVAGWVIGATETELTVTYGYANWKMVGSTIPYDKNVHTLDIANGAQYLDGDRFGNGTISAMKPTFALFALNENGTAKYFQNYRIHGCQIYDGETLVRDFIPCAQGMNGALYDQVSKDLFENRGTGSFSVPVAGNAFHLASYVECDGTQYVDAGFTPKANTRVIIDLQYVDSGEAGTPGVCGLCESHAAYLFAVGNTKDAQGVENWISWVGKSWNDDALVLSGEDFPFDRKRHQFDIQNGSQKLDGVEYAKKGYGADVTDAAKSFCFFACRQVNGGSMTMVYHQKKVRFYGCKVYEGENLTHDFVPAVDAAGVFGILDVKWSRILYPAAGNPLTGRRKSGLVVSVY